MSNGTNNKCLICSVDLPTKKKGKPLIYCSPNCRNVYKYLNALETSILKIEFKGSSSNLLKGQLFILANKIQCQSKEK